MQYRTHLATSLAVTLPIMASNEIMSVGGLIALGLGALFPDVDEPHSWIGCRTRGVSDFINLAFGHRGLTHSLSGITLTFLTIVLMVNLTPLPAHIGIFFIIGYALHLIEDSFSKSGIKWLLPLSDKKYQSGMGIVYYKTGGMAENIILIVTVFILIIEIKSLNFSGIAISDINIIQKLSDFIKKISTIINL